MLVYICMCVGDTESVAVGIPHLKCYHVLGSADAQQCLPIDLKH